MTEPAGAILVNGRLADRVRADDRGLLYGDGLFETVAFYSGRAPLWRLHMARLAHGCRRLAIGFPGEECLAAEAGRLASGDERIIIRITLTRGEGGRAYFPPDSPDTTRIVMRRPFPADIDQQQQSGIAAVTWSGSLEASPQLAGLKHLNRLTQVLIAAECDRAGAREALVFDSRGRMVEALTGNVVVVRNGRPGVPEPHPAAVAGVGLEWFRQHAGEAVEIAPITANELGPDVEIWVINSVTGIRPIRRLDGHERPISQTCRHWQARWNEMVTGSG